MIIQHNLLAMQGQRTLNSTGRANKKTTEKLSSGYKINIAADNAAGLAISEKMRGQIRGLDRGTDNAQDGISLVQTADGAMAEIQDILHRMRELSVQAANDTNTLSDREAIQKEIDSLSMEIVRTANDTEYNTKKILKPINDDIKTVTGDLATLQDTFRKVGNAQKIEEWVPETITISSHYKENSLPDWVFPTDPANPLNLTTTTTGYLTEKIDLGEKKNTYSLQYSYTDTNGVAVSNTVSIGESNYNSANSGKLTSVDYWLDATNGNLPMVTENYSDGSNAQSTFAGFMTRNYRLAQLFSSVQADATGNKTIDCTYTCNPNALTIAHNGGVIDFSQLNETNINALVSGTDKHGFNATCTACDKHYSISFVNGTGDKYYGVDQAGAVGQSMVYEVDIKSLLDKAAAGNAVTGSDLVDTILGSLNGFMADSMSEVQSDYQSYSTSDYNTPASGINGIKFEHHQALFKDPNNNNGMIFIDTNNYSAGSAIGDRGIFAATVFEGDEIKTVYTQKPVNIDLEHPENIDPEKKYTMHYVEGETEFFRIQVGANSGQEMAMVLPQISLNRMSINELSVLSHDEASCSIECCDRAINYVSKERGRMGAYQNRLEHVTSGNANTSENVQSSESVLRDADMAEEMTKYSKNNILMQAGQSMLAQANQSTQGVLSLLG